MTSKKALSLDSRKQNKTLSGKGRGIEYEYYSIPDTVCDVNTLSIMIRKKNVRVVDVRKEEEYAREHIPGAVSLPLAKILEKENPAQYIELLQDIGVNQDLPVVTYDDTFGALAARVAWTFQYVGHQHTALLEMTFKQWKELGLETENQQRTFPKARHSLRIKKDIYVDASYVESAAKSKPGTVLVDSRERLNYLTEHIPGARNIPYTMVGSEDSILRNAEELKRLIENRGITNDAEIITYCGSVGTLSGLTYYALKLAGFKNVKLYPKSFKEWKALGKPKEEFKDATYWDLSAE